MDQETLVELITEIRADNQIPPYTSNDIIARSIQRCAARLSSLRRSVDFDTDLVGRGYLKDFVYYDMVHRTEEFMENYGPDIRAWMLTEELDEEDSEEVTESESE